MVVYVERGGVVGEIIIYFLYPVKPETLYTVFVLYVSNWLQ